jgi:hypothetical protein
MNGITNATVAAHLITQRFIGFMVDLQKAIVRRRGILWKGETRDYCP